LSRWVEAKQNGELRVMLETGCLELINLWKKKKVQPSIVDPVLKEIDNIRLPFHDFSFSYVNGYCNKKVAHVLVKQVLNTHRAEMLHVTQVYVFELVLFLYEASTG